MQVVRILSIERVGEVTVIRFPSSPDRSYVVEQTDHLVSPQWSTVSGTLNGTGSAIRVEISGASSASAGFVRIREL